MSRSGYSDDLEPWELIKWRGQVASAIRGKRGQKMLRELKAALEAMPRKRLIERELETEEGEYCALGVLGRARGLDMVDVDPEDATKVAQMFDIAKQLAKEVVYLNDEVIYGEDPEKRWARMHRWVCGQIRETP